MTLRQQYPEKNLSRSNVTTEWIVHQGYQPQIEIERQSSRKAKVTLKLFNFDGSEVMRFTQTYTLGQIKRYEHLWPMLFKARSFILEGEDAFFRP